MDCCASISRALLIFFNFIFWLCGAAILGVGIWFLVDKDISSKIDIIDTGDQYFNYAAYLFIGFGAFVFIVGFAGMCGAIRASKCLLGFYIFFVLLVIFAEIAAAVLLILYRVKIEDEITDLLKKNIQEKYTTSLNVRTGWDLAQIELDCCGATGPDDYMNVSYSAWANNQEFPTTCCVLTNKNAALDDPSTASPRDQAKCFNKTSDYHSTGCKESLKEWALKYSTIIIGVGIGIAVLEIFSIVWACCYCRNIGKDD